MRLALSFLRLLPPEISHFIALHALKILYKANLISLLFPHNNSSESFQFKGLTFKNRKGKSENIHQITILNIDTDEGVLEPLGVGEMNIEVRY